MTTFIKSPTPNPWLLRAQLSFEQNAVFEWCSRNLGIGRMDDKDTILKLIEPHYASYQASLQEQPKVNIAPAPVQAPIDTRETSISEKPEMPYHPSKPVHPLAKKEINLDNFMQSEPTAKPESFLTSDEEERLAWLQQQDFKNLDNDDIDELNSLYIKKRGGL